MLKSILPIICLFVGFSTMTFASSIDFNNKSITDDEIASAIKNPKPASISTVTQWLDTFVKDGKFQDEEIRKLNLSENNITYKGATQLFNYILEHLPTIEEIDLSANRIRDGRGNEEYEAFEKILEKVLKMPKFQALIVKTNYLGIDWYRYVASKFAADVAEKIHWN